MLSCLSYDYIGIATSFAKRKLLEVRSIINASSAEKAVL